MEINKRKYKKEEVVAILNELKSEYNRVFIEQKEKIQMLTDRNERLEAELSDYKNKDDVIVSSIKSAESKAKDIEKAAKVKTELEEEKLKRFYEKWAKNIELLKKADKNYRLTNKEAEIAAELNEIVHGGKLSSAVFNPKQIIKDHLKSEEQNIPDDGIDINEVLNPGELSLEDLCKELGLMED